MNEHVYILSQDKMFKICLYHFKNDFPILIDIFGVNQIILGHLWVPPTWNKVATIDFFEISNWMHLCSCFMGLYCFISRAKEMASHY